MCLYLYIHFQGQGVKPVITVTLDKNKRHSNDNIDVDDDKQIVVQLGTEHWHEHIPTLVGTSYEGQETENANRTSKSVKMKKELVS